MNYTLVIITRQDLKMNRGLICSDAIRATIMAMDISNPNVVDIWRKNGMRKLILKTESLKDFTELHKKLSKKHIDSTFVHNNNLIPMIRHRGNATMMAIEIIDEKRIDNLIKNFKLL